MSAPDAGTDGSLYNYVVTAHKPSNVTKSIVGHFTSPTDVNLIIAKSTRIEVHLLTADGLQGVSDVPIYGRISTMELFRPQCEEKDLLFLSTERYHFCVLEWDSASGELKTRANGNLADKVGRPCDNGQIGVIDPRCRLIALHLYDGLLKIIPIDDKGQLQEAFNIRLEELAVIDIKFLHGPGPKPTVGVLYEDTRGGRHVKTYEVLLRDKDIQEGPWQQNNVDAGASMLIPVPAPFGGALVVGEAVLAYLSDRQPMKAVSMRQTVMRAYGWVDEDGSRLLLGDYSGRLHLLVLAHDNDRVLDLKLQQLGRTSTPSTISYLDSGVVFVGSSFGDSQLIKLHATPPNPQEPGNYVEVIDSIPNLGPIVDFCVVDLDRQGQGQVVTCSGVAHEGSLRIVRNGIGVIEQASIELPGIKGVWSLRGSLMDLYDTHLVLSFVGETRLLAINEDDELDEAQVQGFEEQAQTLWCGNVVDDQWAQITGSGVSLVSCTTKQRTARWDAPQGSSINVAAANPSQMLLALGGRTLVLLAVGPSSLQETGRLELQQEVACLDITPLEAGEEGEAAVVSHLAAVGTWDKRCSLYSLPGLKQVTSEVVGTEVIPRSVLLATFEGKHYLLCAMGDGHLINFRMDRDSGALSERKTVSLGTKPIWLSTFTSAGQRHVFAASDRPTIIYSNNGKLLYSNLNENEANFMASFNSSSFPDSLAIAKQGGLTIGGIDEVQKLHIRTVPLGEQPRRIAHQEGSRTFAVLTTQNQYSTTDDAGTDYVRLLDEQTFETVDRYRLEGYEMCCSVSSMRLGDDPQPYFVVGTAVALPDEEEPSRGRVLVFRVKQDAAGAGKLQLVTEKDTRGAVFTVLPFQGKLLACINSRVQLYRWAQREDGNPELANECGHSGHVMALYAATSGDFVVVGDLMKSMQLLVYKPEEGALELRASDYHNNWMTSVAVLDDEAYIGAENSFNLFVVKRNSDSATDEERNRLEVAGEYHLGEMVNAFRRGSLVMQLPDSEASRLPTLLYGTISGQLGVVASLPKAQFEFLERLQACMRRVVNGIGGLSHETWRSFSNERGTTGCRGFVDGDLIEQFLDLSKVSRERVADDMGAGVLADDIYQQVEELSRLH